jgi:hypothetical protein
MPAPPQALAAELPPSIQAPAADSLCPCVNCPCANCPCDQQLTAAPAPAPTPAPAPAPLANETVCVDGTCFVLPSSPTASPTSPGVVCVDGTCYSMPSSSAALSSSGVVYTQAPRLYRRPLLRAIFRPFARLRARLRSCR